ncbi:unnamed protein product [Allacma fusca]|uniref:Uncharacterized protein n=1 Tax=Allacma fusca TaxID=39272 RepID=A0A8J2P243_9HEXA|nr:unnamed protein product [Allacma fusca]
MFQDKVIDDRLSKLESSVSCMKGSFRELKEKCKLLETKSKLHELLGKGNVNVNSQSAEEVLEETDF